MNVEKVELEDPSTGELVDRTHWFEDINIRRRKDNPPGAKYEKYVTNGDFVLRDEPEPKNYFMLWSDALRDERKIKWVDKATRQEHTGGAVLTNLPGNYGQGARNQKFSFHINPPDNPPDATTIDNPT